MRVAASAAGVGAIPDGEMIIKEQYAAARGAGTTARPTTQL